MCGLGDGLGNITEVKGHLEKVVRSMELSASILSVKVFQTVLLQEWLVI
jgi:hypothetical protein